MQGTPNSYRHCYVGKQAESLCAVLTVWMRKCWRGCDVSVVRYSAGYRKRWGGEFRKRSLRIFFPPANRRVTF